MITLLDARSDSLTVTWPIVPGATRYVLELKEGSDENFRELSSKLTQPQAKKKNLAPGQSYSFRVGPVMKGDDVPAADSWISHTEPFSTLPSGAAFLEAPTTVPGGHHALVVKWKAREGATGYELQLRENQGGAEWTTIAASLAGTEGRKKNLTSEAGYQFRVRPAGGSEAFAFSPPSEARVARGLSQAVAKRWFGTLEHGTLLQNKGNNHLQPVPLTEALGGKEFILLYASAHWCPPCRKFTPMLANWYKTVGKAFAEVVFVSCDHDEASFRSYFASSHPWCAVDYEDPTRETLMATIQVSGIPRLVVINAATGSIVDTNAVGKPLDLNAWRNPAAVAAASSCASRPCCSGGSCSR